jgi:hypothetical protein
MTTLNAITSPSPALVTTVDSTGNLVLQTAGTNAVTYDANQNATHTGSISSVNTFGYKNRIINGGMLIWQRATSNTGGIGYVTADRWSMYSGTSPAMSQSTDAPNGYRYSANVSGSGASTGLTQKIESYNVSDLYQQTITVSFWLKQTVGAGSGAISIALSYATAQDNFGSTTSIGSANINTTSSWAQYSATFTNLPSGVINGLQTTISTTGAGAATFFITGVQLEVGSKATPFDMRDYGNELRMCQRYFSTTYSAGIAVGSISSPNVRTAFCLDTTSPTRSWFINCNFPTPMRVYPTTTIYNHVTGATGSVYEYSSGVTRTVSSINSAGNNGDQGMFGYMNLSSNEGTSDPVQFHMASSAEL